MSNSINLIKIIQEKNLNNFSEKLRAPHTDTGISHRLKRRRRRRYIMGNLEKCKRDGERSMLCAQTWVGGGKEKWVTCYVGMQSWPWLWEELFFGVNVLSCDTAFLYTETQLVK